MNSIVTLELVDLATSSRYLLNRRIFISLGVPITGVKLESVPSTRKLRLVLVLLFLLKTTFSTLSATCNLIAVERSQFRIALGNYSVFPQNRGGARGQTAEVVLLSSVLTDRARGMFLLVDRSFLGDA